MPGRLTAHSARTAWGGYLLVLLGTLFLGANFGWWGIDFGRLAIILFGAFLILAGLRLTLGRALAATICSIATIILAAMAYFTPISHQTTINHGETGSSNMDSNQDISITNSPSTQPVDVTLTTGAAHINIGALDSSSDKLIAATATNMGNINLTQTANNDARSIVLAEGSSSGPGTLTGRKLSMKFARNQAIVLNLETGASTVTADLSALTLPDIALTAGASQIDLKLPNPSPRLDATLKTGATSLTIHIPKSASLQIIAASGLSSQHFNVSDLAKNGNTYTQKGFESSTSQISLSIQSGLTSVTIDRY